MASKKPAQVTVVKVRRNQRAPGERTYDLQPVSYAGPWELTEGTVLEIVKEPK